MFEVHYQGVCAAESYFLRNGHCIPPGDEKKRLTLTGLDYPALRLSYREEDDCSGDYVTLKVVDAATGVESSVAIKVSSLWRRLQIFPGVVRSASRDGVMIDFLSGYLPKYKESFLSSRVMNVVLRLFFVSHSELLEDIDGICCGEKPVAYKCREDDFVLVSRKDGFIEYDTFDVRPFLSEATRLSVADVAGLTAKVVGSALKDTFWLLSDTNKCHNGVIVGCQSRGISISRFNMLEHGDGSAARVFTVYDGVVKRILKVAKQYFDVATGIGGLFNEARVMEYIRSSLSERRIENPADVGLLCATNLIKVCTVVGEEVGSGRMLDGLFLPYAERGDLFQFVMDASSARREGRMDDGLRAQNQRYARQMVAVLSFLHRLGVFHGDLKPENYLLAADDGRLNLIDFGSSIIVRDLRRILSSEREYRQLKLNINHWLRKGTPGYLRGVYCDGLGVVRWREDSDIFFLKQKILSGDIEEVFVLLEKMDIFALGVALTVLFSHRGPHTFHYSGFWKCLSETHIRAALDCMFNGERLLPITQKEHIVREILIRLGLDESKRSALGALFKEAQLLFFKGFHRRAMQAFILNCHTGHTEQKVRFALSKDLALECGLTERQYHFILRMLDHDYRARPSIDEVRAMFPGVAV